MNEKAEMQFRRFGRTGLQVSILGLGSGGTSQLGQSYNLTEREVHELVQRALDLGVNVIDTAPAYGESEALLGGALAGVPRDAYVLSTKFRPVEDDGRLQQPEALRQTLERSLDRLGIDAVDLLYLHVVPPERYRDAIDRFLEPLREAQEAGLVRFVGITEEYFLDHEHQTLRMALEDDLFDAVMVGYNLLSPSAAYHVLPLARTRDVGVTIMCAVRRVIADPSMVRDLVRRWTDEGRLAPNAAPLGAPLDWVRGPGVDSTTDAAYKFAADHPAVGCVLTGTANIDHLEANTRAILGPSLPTEIVQRVISTFAPVGHNVGPHDFR